MASIKDIAKACGVSVATVSKALNGHNDISQATKEKVREAARQIGYMPNSAARALKTNRTYNLGVLFVDEAQSGLTHEFFAAVLDSFKRHAEGRGYDITFINHNIGHGHSSYLEHCRYRGVDGVIAACIEDNRRRFGDPEWEVAGFVNDYETQVCGYPVLGGTDDVGKLLENPEYHFMWGIHMIGRNILTEKTFRRVNIPRERFATIVHKTAFVADSAILEPGAFVMSNCYVGAQARIGQCSLMMANSLVGHNTTVGPLCHFSVGSITSSYITIGLCSDVTLGAKVIEKVKIGNFAVAGAGSLVTRDIPDYEIHVGTPARFMKRVRED